MNSPDGESNFMKADKSIVGWVVAVLLLVAVIIAGSIVISQKASGGQAINITPEPEREVTGTIYVGGEVNNPGYYPVFANDTLDDIIAAAGGLKEGADLGSVELKVCKSADEGTPQKININRAEAWLLEALPGVGEVKAQAIIEYRTKNGFFRDINELKNVPGFGDISFDLIKDFITVND
jgi:competence protein ComEA